MEKEFMIQHGEDRNNLSVSEHEGGVWLSLHIRGGHISTTMTKDQAKQLIEALSQLVEES